MSTLKLNRALHGRSVHCPEDVAGHNVILGYDRPGSGDGVDLFARPGTEVYAMHSGRVAQIADRHGRTGCVYMAGGFGTGRIISVYAHLDVAPGLHVGQKIEAGQVVGRISRAANEPHLHMEVWLGKQPLHASNSRHYVAWLERLTMG